MASEGQGPAAPAWRARCLDCEFLTGAKSPPAARAAGKAHAIDRPAHDVQVEPHPSEDVV